MGKLTVRDIVKMKGKERIVMVTAYDYPTARIADEAGVDVILVGDSLGMVVLGYESTLPVTMDDMIRHTRAVARATPRALVVGDMPFGSYEPSNSKAIESAIEFARAGADAVKLEGGSEYSDRVKSIVEAGIPVMGHIGLTPQRVLRLGGYRPQGRRVSEARELLRDAEELEAAGAFSLVIEFTAEEVAARITERISIPTICIGSGRMCDGQVLVLHDILGLSDDPPPFAKRYINLRELAVKALREFKEDVKSGRFPGEEHVVHAKERIEL